MKFRLYIKGSIVANPFDDRGSVCLQRSDGTGLLRTSDGIPRSVVDLDDVADVANILGCVAEDLDRDACVRRGVQVDS